MISVIWRGRAVSENERHAVRWIRRATATGVTLERPAIKAKREYEAFVSDLAYTIMGEVRRQATVKRYSSLSLLVQLEIGPEMDGQNLLKPICDAIQRSRILVNDRNIRHRAMLPDERHPPGEVDTIHLMLYELEEEEIHA